MTHYPDVFFPVDMDYGSTVDITWNNKQFTVDSGARTVNQIWEYPKQIYSIKSDNLCDEDYQKIIALYYNTKGSVHSFNIKDPYEFNMVNETLGTGDGTTTSYQVYKTYTEQGLSYKRKIQQLDTSSLLVEVNGSSKVFNVDYTVSNGVIIFNTAPANGESVVLAGGEFYVPVYFKNDALPTTFTGFRANSLNSITLAEETL